MSHSSDPGLKIAETADDAALSKMSAIRAGYYVDPFLSCFIRRPGRRSPLINRGYYARVVAVDLFLARFLAVARATGDGRAQVLNLGAGVDTAFWRAAAGPALQPGADAATPASGLPKTLWVELDFPAVTARKAETIATNERLLSLVAGRATTAADLRSPSNDAVSPGSSGPRSPPNAASSGAPAAVAGVTFAKTANGGCDVTGAGGYRLITADLRDITGLRALVAAAGIDVNVPTLLLSECVLVYLEPEDSCAIIAWAAREFKRSVFMTYEQVRPHDAFGQVMSRSLEERGYSLRGLNAFPDIASQVARYRELGYSASSVADMNDIYYRVLPRADVVRAERLELFDELEEWHLMSAHYCIAVAINDGPRRSNTAAPSAADASSAVDDGMPAPAPKVPRSIGDGGASRDLSPQAVAAAVVRLHENEADDAAAQAARTRADSIAASTRSAPRRSGGVTSPNGFAGDAHTPRERSLSMASTGGGNESTTGSAVGGSGRSSPFPYSAVLRSSTAGASGHGDTIIIVSHGNNLSRSASAAGGTSAAGTDDGAPPASPSDSSFSAMHDGSRRSSDAFSHPYVHPHPAATPPSQALAGTLVGGSLEGLPDFLAMAEAEDEMAHARAVRGAAGIDIDRDEADRRDDVAGLSSRGGGGRGMFPPAAAASSSAAPAADIGAPLSLYSLLLPTETWIEHLASKPR